MRKPLVVISAVAIVAAGTVLVLELTNTTHIFHKDLNSPVIPAKSVPAKTSSGSASSQSAPSSNQGVKNTSQPSEKSSTATVVTGTNATLVKPFGSFVSNHQPGKNGSSTTEVSTCNTTAGASCYIEFTKDGVTKKLDPRTVDSSGAAYWNWDVKDAGFSGGNWTIQAVASLNGQTQRSTDSQPLEINP